MINNKTLQLLKGYFESKKKNLISLFEDSSLSNDTKVIKVGEENSPLELSRSQLKVRGTIDADEIKVNSSPVVHWRDVNQNAIDCSSDLEIKSTGDINFVAAGFDINFVVSDNAYFNWNVLGTTTFYYPDGTNNNGLQIDVSTVATSLKSFGTTSLKIASASAGNLTLDVGLNQLIFSNDGTTFQTFNFQTASTAKWITNTDYHLIFETAGTGDITLDSGGDIVLDSHDGNFIAKKAGTEFSSANSSYAGMILGITMLRNASDTSSRGIIQFAGTTWDIFDSYQGTVCEVTFKAPPSGNVEIVLDALATNTNDYLELSLSSDNSSYTEVNAIQTYAYSPAYMDESDRHMLHFSWIVEGLTAGSSYTYSVWGRTNGSSNRSYFYHGMVWGYGGNSKQAPPIVIKALALPSTITSGE